MNLGDIQGRVQRQFGDDSQAQILLTDITRWANDAQVDIVRRTHELQAEFNITTAVGVAGYNLPTDFIAIKRVTYDGWLLKPTTLEELDAVFMDRDTAPSKDTPGYWYKWAKQVKVYPVPSADQKIMDLWYVRAPVALSVPTDVPEIAPQRHEDIVRYCLARAQELDENYGGATAAMKEYSDRIGISKTEEDFERDDSYPAIRALPGDGGVDPYSGVAWR